MSNLPGWKTFSASAAILLAACAWAQAPYTTIADTLPPGALGKPVNGSINVIWTQFTYSGFTIVQSPANGVNYPIVNGVVNIPLVPTDHANGVAVYKVITTNGGNPVTTTWQVPSLPSAQCALASSCTVKEVTVAFPAGPPVQFNPFAQLSCPGCVKGNLLVWNGMGWARAPVCPTSQILAYDSDRPLGVKCVANAASGGLNTVPAAAAVNYDLSLGSTQFTVLTTNIGAMTFSNATPGKAYTFIFQQDIVGGRTVVMSPNMHAVMTVGPSAGFYSSQTFVALNSTTLVALAPGLVNQ